jgi:RHS repeat-associated protein
MPNPQYPHQAKKVSMYYDPRGQVVRTVNPDNSQQWVLFGRPTVFDHVSLNDLDLPTLDSHPESSLTPWESCTFDANDLADRPPFNGSGAPSTHWNTPKTTVLDALGRTVKTIDRLAAGEEVVMKYEYDIRGNLLKVTEALGRTAFTHVYDLADRPLRTTHIDSGASCSLTDAIGKPIESTDAKGARTLVSYDTLQRPVHGWAQNNGSDTLRMVMHNRYGEESTDPADSNLLGKPWQQYDEAGRVEFTAYDFKGNLLNKVRKVFNAATLKGQLDGYASFLIDWTSMPDVLDTFDYATSSSYDALNRVIAITLPENVDEERKEITPSYNRAGALEKVNYDGTDHVRHIAYNAKGQRLLIAFGNDVMTRYAYDPRTFRPVRQRSEKYTFGQAGNTINYTPDGGTNRQDEAFNYDLAGNIINIITRVNGCGISGSSLGSDALNRSFTYDPLYRLISATGRESDTHSADDYLYADAPAPGVPNADNVRAYTRQYQYDKLGNIQQLKQTGANGFTRNFTYNTGVNTLQKIENGSSALLENFTYDSVGNQLTAGTTRHYRWTAANRLLEYKNQAGGGDPTIFAQYDYDASGTRVSKLVRTGSAISPIYERTIYIDGIFEHHRLENGSDFEKNYVHIMDGRSRISMVRIGDQFPGDIDDEVVYNLEDQIGSSSVRLDEDGVVIDREEFYPFGDSSLRTFTKKRYRYVGKEKDIESGLYYYGARYYSAWTCRFISVDPLAAKFADLSPYNYAGNRPIIKMDIDGLQEEGRSETPQSITTEKMEGGVKITTTTTTTVEIDTNGVKTTTKDISKEFMVGDTKIGSDKSTEKYSDPTFKHDTATDDQTHEESPQPGADPIGEVEASTTMPAEESKVETAKEAVKSEQADIVLKSKEPEPLSDPGTSGGKRSGSSSSNHKFGDFKGKDDADMASTIIGSAAALVETAAEETKKEILEQVKSLKKITSVDKLEWSKFSKIAKYAGWAGKASGFYGIINASVKLYNEPSATNLLKLGANTGMVFMKSNPYTLAISLGYTALDESGAIDKGVSSVQSWFKNY